MGTSCSTSGCACDNGICCRMRSSAQRTQQHGKRHSECGSPKGNPSGNNIRPSRRQVNPQGLASRKLVGALALADVAGCGAFAPAEGCAGLASAVVGLARLKSVAPLRESGGLPCPISAKNQRRATLKLCAVCFLKASPARNPSPPQQRCRKTWSLAPTIRCQCEEHAAWYAIYALPTRDEKPRRLG